MKICAVIPSYLPHYGGAEVGIHEIFKYLATTTEHEFYIVTTTQDIQSKSYETIDNVHVYRYQRIGFWAKWYAPTIQALSPVMKLVQEIRPDTIIITYMLPIGIAACVAAQRLNIPLVMSLGGADIYDPYDMPDKFLQFLSGYFIRRNPIVVTWSQWVKDWLIAKHKLTNDRIEVIPFSVDTQRFHTSLNSQYIRDRYKIHADTILLLALQRLEVRKGVDILIRAFQRVINNCPGKTTKLLIGGKGLDSDKLKALVNELGLENNVIFSGFIPEEEKPLYYAASDIFVLHTYHEGLGIVLEEAAATGTPQISTYAGGTVDVVDDGETGFLVESGNVERLATAICDLIKQPHLMEQMGQNAAQKMEDNFTIESVATRYLSIFEASYNSS